MRIKEFHKTVHITNLIGSFFSDFSQKKKKQYIFVAQHTDQIV